MIRYLSLDKMKFYKMKFYKSAAPDFMTQLREKAFDDTDEILK